MFRLTKNDLKVISVFIVCLVVNSVLKVCIVFFVKPPILREGSEEQTSQAYKKSWM